MSDLTRKRSAEGVVDNVALYNDPAELVNAVISALNVPEQKTVVAETYSNERNQALEVQAYAKIAGNDWTYYVKSLEITIGRNTEAEPPKDSDVQIDLGPAKVVSRLHARIQYNTMTRVWELFVAGRNGAKVDGVKVPCGPNSSPTSLYSGSVVDIGGTQMMFILPDALPKISPHVLDILAPRLPKPNSKKMSLANVNGQSGSFTNYNVATTNDSNSTNINDATKNLIGNNNSTNNNLKGFQMFSNNESEYKEFNANGSPGMNGNSMENDLSKDEARDIKPPYSYATMITQAILSNPEGVLSLSEIYDWIARHYAFYRYSKSGWQNSIRHNLSLNKAFEKVPRRANEPGKGMKWQISDSYKNEFLKKVQSGSLSKARRGSSVSRQLQLHLALHNDLPVSQIGRRKIPQYQPPPPPQAQSTHQIHQLPYQQLPPNPHLSHAQYHPNAAGAAGGAPATGPPPPPSLQPHHHHSNSHDALQFMANAAANVNPNQSPYPPPPQPQQQQHQGPYPQAVFPPTQLPPLQQPSQQGGSVPPQPASSSSSSAAGAHSTSNINTTSNGNQLPFPQPSAQSHPQSLYSHSRGSSLGSTTFPTTTTANTTQFAQQSSITESPKLPPIHTSTENRLDNVAKSEPQTQLSSPVKSENTPKKQLYQSYTSQNTTTNNTTINNDSNISKNDNHNNNNNNSQMEFGMSITSPTKSFSIGAVEAYTPERGVRKSTDVNGGLQSSPALWNFVQFSTPLQPGAGNSNNNNNNNNNSRDEKDGEDKNKENKLGKGSPIKNIAFMPDSPLNNKQNASHNNGKEEGDLKDVDLAKGFKK